MLSPVIQKLTEGIIQRDVRKEGAAILAKWKDTGLLEGITDEYLRKNVALLLENQAKQVLKEISDMSGGDVQGFSQVSFPLVRRIFAGLVANDIVSVQPMSMPTGLIFFLDFTYHDTKTGAGAVNGESVYGGGVVGYQITGGVNLFGAPDETNDLITEEKGRYFLNNAYSLPTGSGDINARFLCARSGSGTWYPVIAKGGDTRYSALGDYLIDYDPSLSGSSIAVYNAQKASFTNLDLHNLVGIHASTGSYFHMVRHQTKQDPLSSSCWMFVFATWNSASEAGGFGEDTSTPATPGFDLVGDARVNNNLTFYWPIVDPFTTAGTQALGAVVGTTPWGLEATNELTNTGTNADIPEIDIKVDSVSVTAMSRKLKAKWTQELGQDINAYHNLDAEVELTGLLSELIALEIDREILKDLIEGATGGVFYWSRKPGQFVHKTNGTDITANGAYLPDFTGNVSQWYETLLETINDVSAQIYRKTLIGGANFLVTSPEVSAILEATAGFAANVTVGEEKGFGGPKQVGSINRKWDVYVDPYFPRNLVLVGRKGNSFLDSGYVYAPYVPLQVSPTIFNTEDWSPRKSVMTRYSKKMVRPDMYGLVVVRSLLGY